MNEELLEKAKQFEIGFLNKYPTVEQPSELISKFATSLNDYKSVSTEHGETINSIWILLSNRDLEKFAEAGKVEKGADEVVYGDKEANLAGLKELIRKLITDLG